MIVRNMALRFVLSLSFLILLLLSPLSAAAAAQKSSPEKEAAQGGVGLQVVPIATCEIVVVAVLPQSPAAKAKIVPGDLIIAVDDAPLRGSDFEDITKTRLWGKAGTKVKLTWMRPGVAGKKSAELVRSAVKNAPAKDLAVKMLVPGEEVPAKGENHGK